MTTLRKPGRPPAAGEPRSYFIRARATAEEVAQFEAVGGADWLRRALRQAFARLQRKSTSSNQPRPAGTPGTVAAAGFQRKGGGRNR